MDNCIRDQGYAVMQTSRDGIIENFDRGNAEGAALDRQTEQSRAAGAHTLIRSRRIGKAPGREVAPVAIDDLGGPEKHSLDLSRLTNEELERLEQILAKTK